MRKPSPLITTTLVRTHLRGPGPIFSRSVSTRIEELDLKPVLDRTVASHPSGSVRSYPRWFDAAVRTVVTFDGRESPEVDRALESFVQGLPAGEPRKVE